VLEGAAAARRDKRGTNEEAKRRHLSVARRVPGGVTSRESPRR
jgi:hypothetical protein